MIYFDKIFPDQMKQTIYAAVRPSKKFELKSFTLESAAL